MKKRILFSRGIAAVALLAAVACAKVENDPPKISLSRPEVGKILLVGGDVRFQCAFTDDRQLKSYRVQITPLEGGETVYDSGDIDIAGYKDYNVDEQLGVLASDPLTGEDFEKINIDNATPGKYKFVVACVDAAGNNASNAVHEIEIK